MSDLSCHCGWHHRGAQGMVSQMKSRDAHAKKCNQAPPHWTLQWEDYEKQMKEMVSNE